MLLILPDTIDQKGYDKRLQVHLLVRLYSSRGFANSFQTTVLHDTLLMVLRGPPRQLRTLRIFRRLQPIGRQDRHEKRQREDDPAGDEQAARQAQPDALPGDLGGLAQRQLDLPADGRRWSRAGRHQYWS